jgi:hypothetical protein
MAQSYGEQLSNVRGKIAGIDMAQGAGGVQKATTQFNGLSNSINQLTREMPAFTYSVQTGFMALSNNIPMFVDQIQSIKRANLELSASGQPVTSVFKQVATSFLSFNTLMSVGITALTMFSPLLVEFADELFNASHAQDEYNKNQKESLDLIYEYLATEKEKAIKKETEAYEEASRALRENIRLTALSVEASQVEGVSRFDLIMKKTKDIETLEKIEKRHVERLADINDEGDSKKRVKMTQQAEWEVNLFEDKFTKMKDALAKFKSEDSFQAMKDLALPIFDANTINIQDIEKAVDTIIQPFYALEVKIKGTLERILDDMGGWVNIAAGVMAQAGQALGAALVTGDFDEAGKAIVRQLGGIAIQIGAALIAMGIPQAVLGLPSGFAYIAGGTALTVVGGAMQATGSAGKNSPAPAPLSAGGGGGQMSFNPAFASSSQYLDLSSTVRGTDIVISADNQRRNNRRIR